WPTPTDSGTLETPRTAAPSGLAAVVGRAGDSAHHRLRTVAAAGSTRAHSARHELARPRWPRPGYRPLLDRRRPRRGGRRDRGGRVHGCAGRDLRPASTIPFRGIPRHCHGRGHLHVRTAQGRRDPAASDRPALRVHWLLLPVGAFDASGRLAVSLAIIAARAHGRRVRAAQAAVTQSTAAQAAVTQAAAAQAADAPATDADADDDTDPIPAPRLAFHWSFVP